VSAPRFRRYPSETRAAMLVEAGLACLARGGIQGFTLDNICREADASRGLVAHHFGSKDGLLAACYGAMYDRVMGALRPDGGPADLGQLLDACLAPGVFNGESLRVWLALWGEIAHSEGLRETHRRLYAAYRAEVAAAIAAEAAARGLRVEAEALAAAFIALSDGVWLEHAIDPDLMPVAQARGACRALLEAHLGPLRRADMDLSAGA
jgi:TetR/AcrR family transcriptional regulator, transcriptional repressor of bet genes